MAKRVYLCKSHPDFHTPPDVDVGEGFDGEAYARRLKECGADAVAFFAKCHYGHSYYPTEVGNVHPRLKKDMLAEVVAGCHRHGLGVVAYYSVFLDTVAMTAHPDWRVQATAGMADGGFDSGHFQRVCVNSPYTDELLIPQCVEIVTRYDADELFLDTMMRFSPCFCGHCRRSFGRDIPESADDPDWLDYVRWYAERYDEFFAKVAAAVNEANPDACVAFNWKWACRQPDEPAPHIGRLSADLIPTGWMASMVCRYFAGTGYPFDYMTGRFLHGLGDWNSNTPETIKNTAATTVANGGSFYIIDRQLPDGSLEERAWEMMKDVFGFVQERREWLVGAEHVPETAALFDCSSVVGSRLEFFPDAAARKERMKPFEATARLFMEHSRHYTALGTHRLPAKLSDYRLLVLPESEFLDAATRRMLADYVEAGGRLLISQAAWDAEPDGDLLALAGVTYEGRTELGYGYFGTEPPLMVRVPFAKVVAGADAEVVWPHVAPLTAGKGGRKFGHGFAPPTVPDGYAAVASRRIGAGEVVYVAAPVFRAYLDHQSPRLARLLLALVDRLLPDPIVRVRTPAQVEMTTMRKGDDLIVHLVNHSGKERLGGYHYPVTEYIPEIRDIGVSLRPSDGMAELYRAPSRTPVHFTESDDRAEFVLDRLHIMETIVAPGYFADKG